MRQQMQHPNPEEAKSSVSDWPKDLQADLVANRFNPCVGSILVSESLRVRVWQIWLKPGERLPFHRHVLDYFWTVISSGKSRSHCEDGRILEVDYQVGDTAHFHFRRGEHMVHDLSNIGDTVLGFVTVECLESANEPLPLPEEVRAGYRSPSHWASDLGDM